MTRENETVGNMQFVLFCIFWLLDDWDTMMYRHERWTMNICWNYGIVCNAHGAYCPILSCVCVCVCAMRLYTINFHK